MVPYSFNMCNDGPKDIKTILANAIVSYIPVKRKLNIHAMLVTGVLKKLR